MWIAGKQLEDNFKDFNHEVKLLSGELNDVEAKITLAKFLRHNIGLTLKLFGGYDLFPFQEIIIKSILNRDVSLLVGGRGISKSTMIAILSILYPIFYPNSSMCLISTNFRSSRRILEAAEKIAYSKNAELLHACYDKRVQRAPDVYRWQLPNGSEVFSLPLSNGDGLRGTRCHLLVVDEFVNVPSSTVNTILVPFLTVKQNVQKENEIKKIEDDLISKGALTEKDRISFPRNKFCMFSSASYEFEYLYTVFSNNVQNIMYPEKNVTEENKSERPPTYFVARLSYEMVPENMLFDKSVIMAARANGGENTDYFKREYRGIFSNSNDGFFSAKLLNELTVKSGEYPTTQIKGQKGCKYLLSVDPSYSANASSDYFSFGVYLLDEEERKLTLVNSYARRGGDITQHFEYLTYLLNYFNIVFIIYDESGKEFIDGYNSSTIAANNSINLDFIYAEFDTDDSTDYAKSLLDAKNQYNLLGRKICYGQKFNSSSIRRLNEFLKNKMEARKIYFASGTGCNDQEFTKQIGITLPMIFKDNDEKILDTADFIDLQDSLIRETKSEIALIEIKSSTSGNLSYDLPASLKTLTSKDRPRKDMYTCCLLACWGAKLYFEMIFSETKPSQNHYVPTLI